jgi:hypothetical protein
MLYYRLQDRRTISTTKMTTKNAHHGDLESPRTNPSLRYLMGHPLAFLPVVTSHTPLSAFSCATFHFRHSLETVQWLTPTKTAPSLIAPLLITPFSSLSSRKPFNLRRSTSAKLVLVTILQRDPAVELLPNSCRGANDGKMKAAP